MYTQNHLNLIPPTSKHTLYIDEIENVSIGLMPEQTLSFVLLFPRFESLDKLLIGNFPCTIEIGEGITFLYAHPQECKQVSDEELKKELIKIQSTYSCINLQSPE